MTATRLRPRGEFFRWASATPGTGVTSARADWAAGRCLHAEEKRCGLLAHMPQPDERVVHLGSAHGHFPRRIPAVYRVQSSDYQLNEVNVLGEVACIRKPPKGRWKKVSKGQSIMIEDDSRVSFRDPRKTHTTRMQSHGEYVRILGRLPEEAPVLPFVVYRDTYSVAQMEHRLLYETGVQRDALGTAEAFGGHAGCITQHGVTVGMTKEYLAHASRHYSLQPLLFEPKSYAPLSALPSILAPPRGNFCRLLLRCVGVGGDSAHAEERRIAACCEALQQHGFINYFGLSSFGIGANCQFELLSAAHRGDYAAAVAGYLQCEAERSDLHFDHLQRYFNASESTAASIAEEWARVALQVNTGTGIGPIIEKLARCTDFSAGSAQLREMWDMVPRKERFYRSAARFVWNAIASQRVLSFGLQVVAGDVVRIQEQQVRESGPLAECDSRVQWRYHVVTADEAKSNVFHISAVVLPVPYPQFVGTQLFPQCEEGVLSLSLYREFAARHGVQCLFEATSREARALAEMERPPLSVWDEAPYRTLIAYPELLEAAIIEDPNSLSALKTDAFLLQERRLGKDFFMDYSTRVREPSTFNVSERFVEKMHPIRLAHAGKASLALTCFLPRGTDASVMLREKFEVHHGTYHDLFACY